MGKRSNFDRLARDSYDTPYDAVIPLLEHLSDNTEFIEPCAGKNALIGHLTQHGHKCLYASDIYPRHDNIAAQCVFDRPFHPKGLIITNPPWDRKILHAFIEKVVAEDRIAWLLFDADWCHTKQSIPFMQHVAEIVSIGRVKWIEGSNGTGKDNCAWHKIMRYANQTIFHGRACTRSARSSQQLCRRRYPSCGGVQRDYDYGCTIKKGWPISGSASATGR